MDAKHETLYQLEMFVNDSRPEIQRVYQKYGHGHVPVNTETLASMVMVHKEPFIDDLFASVSPLMRKYDGNPDNKKAGLKDWISKASGILFGIDSMVNGQETEAEPEKKGAGEWMGLPVWAWVLILLIVVIIIVVVVMYARN
ncbi:hypothetical protein QQ054_01050 [Oscillatoria amoena NRMC-F 0135]|nr:hypothetical protein [Oscillatoria amoena NRMC-F 0135]